MVLVDLCRPGENLEVELLPDHGRRCEQPSDVVAESAHALLDDLPHRARQTEPAELAGLDARLLEVPEQLDHEERIPVGVGLESRRELVDTRAVGVREVVGNEARHGIDVERCQCDLGGRPFACDERAELRDTRDDESLRAPSRTRTRDAGSAVARCRINAMVAMSAQCRSSRTSRIGSARAAAVSRPATALKSAARSDSGSRDAGSGATSRSRSAGQMRAISPPYTPTCSRSSAVGAWRTRCVTASETA